MPSSSRSTDATAFTADDVRGCIAPPTQVLSNGRYTTIITAAGTGYAALGSLALTRWIPDRTRDPLGQFVYLRDETSGDVWSVGMQPVRGGESECAARFAPGCAVLERVHDGIEAAVGICVLRDADVELRQIRLVNRSDRPRTLSVTTYAEAVLNEPAADVGHPAFSKLFVQTGRSGDGQGIMARRRLRSATDEPLATIHRLTGPGELEFETDRMRFIGRGRTLAAPRAMDTGTRLSGTLGNVLDPVLALRRTATLAPGADVCLVWIMAAASTTSEIAEVEAIAAQLESAKSVETAFSDAVSRAGELLGVHATTPERFVQIGELLYGTESTAPRPRTPGESVDDVALYEEARGITTTPRGHVSIPLAPPAPRIARGSGGLWSESLRFFNGYGGFSEDGHEYVVLTLPTPDGLRLPPQPWTNVIANERVGFIASERAASFTWSVNSRLNRLTPWYNDPVSETPGEALYVRDEATGEVMSPTPGPTPGAGLYLARHGLGYTTYQCLASDLHVETTAFVPRTDPVKIVRVRMRNLSTTPRELSLYSYVQLVLGGVAWETASSITTRVDESRTIRAMNPEAGDFASLVAFATAVPAHPASVTFTTDRRAFLGTHGDVDAPAAVVNGTPLNAHVGTGGDPCAAFCVPFTLLPGETFECTFLLGQGEDDAEVARVVEQYRGPGSVERALNEVIAFWQELVVGVQIETPSPAIDLMVNGWLVYQNLSCRIWGRSAFYQSGGAYGFRDQLQDAAALVLLAPERTREQLLRHAAHQFIVGDVLHWWHPPASVGIRTHFSDDLLWLPYITSYYVETTGDRAVLDEQVPFVHGPRLAPDEEERFVRPETGLDPASLYDHCCRALDRSLTAGTHGLPLMGTGDWNDGMNRVGRLGRGESVWLGFFLAYILDRFIPLCEARGDVGRAAQYRVFHERLGDTLNDTGWDGAWYRRAYYDDGTPIGSATSDEGKIDAIAQAWAVISGVAPPDRATMAMEALETHLVSEQDGIIRLLTPAFDRTPHDPGYIKGYIPGVRENGGQYTHGALWAVRALAELGHGDRATALLEMLSPVTHGATPEAIATYQVEPYVIAADVYGEPPHVGRGGWTWYTGSAGWMYRVAVESILGLELVNGDTLVLRPSVPKSWERFRIRYRLPDRVTSYDIVVTRGDAATTIVSDSVQAAVQDGAVRIPLVRDGATHTIHVRLGDDIVPRYALRRGAGHSASEAP